MGFASFFVSILAASIVNTSNAQLAESTINNGVHVPGSIPTNKYEPLEQRLSYMGATGMTVSWNTYAFLQTPTVFYGLTPFLGQVAESNISVTYPTSRTYNNHVAITGLESNTKYYYKVSFTNCQGCAYLPTYSFTTARAVGDMTPFSVAVIVDMGLMGDDGLSATLGPLGTDANPLGANDTNTIQSLLMFKDTYDFVGHWGDIAYADYIVKASSQGFFGTELDQRVPSNKSVIAQGYESLLEQFYDQITPVTSTKPYMVAIGNHDSSCDNGGYNDKLNGIKYTIANCSIGQVNGTGYRDHWRMPSGPSGGVGNMWYSFNHGMAHFVVVSTETDLGNGIIGPDEPGGSDGMNMGPFGSYPNEQVDWLENDLATVNRTLTPWVIVGYHRPWYVSNSVSNPGPRTAFEGLFNKYGVDLAMAGHQHFYERNTPIGLNGTIDPAGLNNPTSPWYIINGAAGHYDGLDSLPYQANFSIFQTDNTYGWSRLIFHNRTHLTQEFIASANGSVIDSATLYKEHSVSNNSPPTTTVFSLPTQLPKIPIFISVGAAAGLL